MGTKKLDSNAKEIRRTLHNKEWWFVVEDMVLALIESKDPKHFVQHMKQASRHS